MRVGFARDSAIDQPHDSVRAGGNFRRRLFQKILGLFNSPDHTAAYAKNTLHLGGNWKVMKQAETTLVGGLASSQPRPLFARSRCKSRIEIIRLV